MKPIVKDDIANALKSLGVGYDKNTSLPEADAAAGTRGLRRRLD